MISLSIFLDGINASPVDSGLSGIILRSRNNFTCTDAEINFPKFFFCKIRPQVLLRIQNGSSRILLIPLYENLLKGQLLCNKHGR